jgi:hypothetical protein
MSELVPCPVCRRHAAAGAPCPFCGATVGPAAARRDTPDRLAATVYGAPPYVAPIRAVWPLIVGAALLAIALAALWWARAM